MSPGPAPEPSTEPPRPGGSVASAPGVPSARDAARPGPIRLRLDVAYDGSGYHGFAPNVGVRTIGGVLRDALATVTGEDVEITCAGRTDTGVHATGQVVSVELEHPQDPHALRTSLNALLAPSVVVRAASAVDGGFDARFSARWRRYEYSVWNRPVPDPFEHGTSWWVSDPLDVGAMDGAAAALVGEHDFSSFCRRPKGAEVSLVRRVLSVSLGPGTPEGMLVFTIAASAFCHQMVRAVTGALVAVGRGRLDPDGFAELLAARDRSGAPNLAPPRGLCLVEVGYDERSAHAAPGR